MDIFHIALTLATFLCSLVAGFLFAFAVVVMPGTGELNDREFLAAFQSMDRVIQNSQPVFMLVWVGSVVALVASGVAGFRRLIGPELVLLLAALVAYLVGVQLPTLAVNVPLNNQLQTLNLSILDEPALVDARNDFEPRWNRWNIVRTVFASLTAVMLILLVLHLR
ncbi:MAG: DUF1772 domain-containing protein [Acidobacteriota bacterium]